MNFPIEINTESAVLTENLGQELAKVLTQNQELPKFIAMYGDLGVGKTSFVKGFCSEICKGAVVKSPTFALVNEYKCCSGYKEKKVYHFDMYRISGEDDLYSIGYYDYLDDDCFCIAEWCEMIPFALPERYIKVSIDKLDFENKRAIKIRLVE